MSTFGIIVCLVIIVPIIVAMVAIFTTDFTEVIDNRGEPSVPKTDKPLVRLHYFTEFGSQNVIIPVDEITDYTRRFKVSSIEPYKREKK